MSATGFMRRRRAQAEMSKPMSSEVQLSTFDMTGSWLSVRAEVRNAVGASRLPQNKAEARQWLADYGYEVVG